MRRYVFKDPPQRACFLSHGSLTTWYKMCPTSVSNLFSGFVPWEVFHNTLLHSCILDHNWLPKDVWCHKITHVELRLKVDTEQLPPSVDECEDRRRKTLNVDVFVHVRGLKWAILFKKVKNIYPILDGWSVFVIWSETLLYLNLKCQCVNIPSSSANRSLVPNHVTTKLQEV